MSSQYKMWGKSMICDLINKILLNLEISTFVDISTVQTCWYNKKQWVDQAIFARKHIKPRQGPGP